MGTGAQLTPPEESGETVSSKEIGGQPTFWKDRGTNREQPALAEIPGEETARALSLKVLVWRSPLTTNRKKWEKTTHHGSVPREH